MSIRFPAHCKTREQRSEFARAVAMARWAKREKRENAELPELVRRITIEDFVSGRRHVFDLKRCRRIDQYRVEVDGKLWRDAAGLATVLAGLRKAWGRYGRMA